MITFLVITYTLIPGFFSQPKRCPDGRFSDFAIVYNLQEEMVEGYTEWISVLHDHTRVGYVIGESLWGTVALE